MPQFDNPAGRILKYLVDAETFSDDDSAMEVWRHLFEIEDESSQGQLRVMSRGAFLLDLTDEVRTQMAALPAEYHADEVLSPFKAVEATLANFRDLPRLTISNFLSPMTPDGWFSLRMADRFLSNQAHDRRLDNEARDELIQRVREAIDLVANADGLSVDTKRLLTRRLRSVEDSIRESRLRGTEDLEAAGDSLIATVLKKSDLGIDWLVTKPSGKVVAGLIMLIGTSLGVQQEYLVLPGFRDVPAIEGPATPGPRVEVDVNVHTDDSEVVEGEIVDEDDAKD